MRAPSFWYRERPGLAGHLLSPLGALYGAVASRRMARAPDWRSPLPVVCIGNPTVGGAGKTPTAIAVAGRLAELGRRPVFLSRGYGGKIEKPTVVDPAAHGAGEVGDEALLLASRGPAVVSPDRVAGAREAESLGDVIVMDDGFQNPALAKTLSLLVVDGARGIGNGLCLPAGPMRAPLQAQLSHADALLVIGEGEPGERLAAASGLPVLLARLAPDAQARADLEGERVLAFAGIGRPEKFFASLEACGAQIAGRRSFPDHHRFTASEAAALLSQASKVGARPVTTQKDMMRLQDAHPDLAAASAVLPVGLELNGDSARVLDRLLARALA